MKSSTGEHFLALDHIRAVAALMVFSWHFTQDCQFPASYVPTVWPMLLLQQGFTGVALFMTLSGYLFAKLLADKIILYPAFFTNRALRLLPLLVVVIALSGLETRLHHGDMAAYAKSIVQGVLLPTLPDGGWSITVEAHFYLLLPLLLWLLGRSEWLPTLVVAAAFALRILVHQWMGTVQPLAYWTIVGRIDQFALGILVCRFRAWLVGRHGVALGAFAGLVLFFWYFARCGGYYNQPTYPSPALIWIVFPTIEGLAYALLIGWYDNSFALPNRGISWFVARIGSYSYSIYLLHFFVVNRAQHLIETRIMRLSNFYAACLWSLVVFLLMYPVGYLSFRYIEGPFLKLRKRYVVPAKNPDAVAASVFPVPN